MEDDIELPSSRGVRLRPYDALPQQELGTHSALSPPYYQNSEPTPVKKQFYSHSTSQPESISDIGESREASRGLSQLPPKAYLQSSRRRRFWIHFANATAFLVALAFPLSIFLPIIFNSSEDFDETLGSTYCTTIESEAQGWSFGNSFSSILNISVAYGSLSFGMAKLVDLVWDVFISRAGQIGLGYITYRVHNAALLRIMEDRLVSYDLYATMTLSWATIWSLRPIVKTFFTKLGFKRKLLLFWLTLSIIWVAVWPTITNAMTGYVAKNTTLVKLADNSSYAAYSEVANSDTLAFQYQQVNPDADLPSAGNWTGPILMKTGPNVTLWTQLSNIVMASKFLEYSIYNYSLPSAATVTLDAQFNEDENTPAYVFYFYNGQKYDFNWFQISDNVQCVATSRYQWGFSTGVLLIFMLFNTCWVIGTYGVWVHMNRKSELCQKHRSLGKYRAAVDIVEAITASLGKNLCAYSDSELESALKRGLGIKYSVTYGNGDAPSHIGLSSDHNGERLRLNFGELYGGSENL